MTPDQQLIHAPRWQPADLGSPLPDSPHANSVCLPAWQDVIDYEEKIPRVMQRLRAGYPRFVVPALCMRFFDMCRERFARNGELCHAYPTLRSARRCIDLIKQWTGADARVVEWPEHRIFVVCFPAQAEASALKYWRHTGEGLSSRQADWLMQGRPAPEGDAARQIIVDRIASQAGVPAENIFLFKSGMAAIYTLHRMAMRMRPGGACVQFGFPYVDTLKIQQDFGFRSIFYPMGNRHEIDDLGHRLRSENISGIITEFPSNPLLNTPDMHALSELARVHRVPLIVDDTIATWLNVDLRSVADVIVTSLTKFFTGRGDVMGGAVILNPARPLFPEVKEAFAGEYEDTTWSGNLIEMEKQSSDFAGRMKQVNRTTTDLCDWLASRPEVEHVYYPNHRSRAEFDKFKKPDGGYSGLFSIVLKNSATTTIPFYNQLRISKGPNLGTTFSLCCPFTLLAHFDELDWAEQCGVSRYLLRFSIGLEDLTDLQERFEQAFAATAG